MKTRIHAIAGVIGILTVAVFWVSTLITELVGSHEAIATLKNGILWGMIILIPALAIAGGSGMSLGQGLTSQRVLIKKKRMPFIALNGLLVLLPCAVFLSIKANAGEIDTTFYVVQSIELLVGAANLTLMGFNFRDGLLLTGRVGGAAAATVGDTPSIELRQNGPVVVTGLSSLIGTDGEFIPTKPTMALCRCGASKSKPFCDGSHTSVNFSDAKLPERTLDELLSYEGEEVTIQYNRLLCSKAHECGNRLSQVLTLPAIPGLIRIKAPSPKS
ncbi:MAG: CDGSH iron-sulfur domain-containing protein [Sneathiella sp.]